MRGPRLGAISFQLRRLALPTSTAFKQLWIPSLRTTRSGLKSALQLGFISKTFFLLHDYSGYPGFIHVTVLHDVWSQESPGNPIAILGLMFARSREYNILVGVKSELISTEISANEKSGNQLWLQGVHVVGLECLFMRLVLIQKTTFWISTDFLKRLLAPLPCILPGFSTFTWLFTTFDIKNKVIFWISTDFLECLLALYLTFLPGFSTFTWLFTTFGISSKIRGWCVEGASKLHEGWSPLIGSFQISVHHNKRWWFQRYKQRFESSHNVSQVLDWAAVIHTRVSEPLEV